LEELTYLKTLRETEWGSLTESIVDGVR